MQGIDLLAEAIISYWNLVEPVFSSIDFTDSERFAASTAGVPREVVLLYATHFCLSEVHNGGFLQFFWNSTGLIAPEVVDGFVAFGMPQMAALVRTAAAALGSPYPRDRDSRWDALLQASGRSQRDLKRIFKKNENLYLAFAEATEPLSYDAMNHQAWDLAKSENGGFQEAATRYARSFSRVQ
jgi:Domain of unknown function (DUF4375)